MNKLRVIHCGTGVAGIQALRAIIEHPRLELAGLLVHGARYVGMDAGVVAGLEPVGVPATNNFEDILRIDAAAVCYMLLLPDLDRICRLLASGKNVVTTAGLLYPDLRGSERSRLQNACERGNSAFYATGINPGWVDEILPLTMSALCRDIRHIHIREYADCAQYPAPHILSVMGFGRSLEEVAAGAISDMTPMREFFRQSISALAHGLDIELDEITESRDFVLSETGFRIKAGEIPANTIAGQRWRWVGLVQGRARITQETFWITAFDLAPDWPRRGDMDNDTQWRVTIEGTPSLRCTFEPRHSFFNNRLVSEPDDFNPSGLATAMAAVNALLPLCSGARGLLTSVDMPLPRGRYVLR